MFDHREQLIRPRRRRAHRFIRTLVQEHQLSVNDLIWPVFVQKEPGASPIATLPGVMRFGLDVLSQKISEAYAYGIQAVALFPHVAQNLKTQNCEEAWNRENLVCRAVRQIRRDIPQIGIICDVALDPYNADGHDGLVRNDKIINDETIDCLIRQALCQAEAGCHILAPSDMMDGRIGALRHALDQAGFQDVALLSYCAKYCSAFYGPFREAVGSAGNLKSGKESYQIDPANGREAELEAMLDMKEGADMLMVKPGMPYLDVIYRLSRCSTLPIFAYQVSGEYAMLAAAAQNTWLDGDKAMYESLLGFKRAGANAIFTYAALDMAKRLTKHL